MNYEKFINIYETHGFNRINNQMRKEGKDYIIQDGDIVTF